MTATTERKRSVYARLLREARPFWRHLVLIFLVSLTSAPLALLAPVPLKIVVDSVLGSSPVPGLLDAVTPDAWTSTTSGVLLVAVALVVATALAVGTQTLAMWLLKTHTAERMVLGFRAQLFRHAQRLSLLYHDTRGTSDSTYRVLYDSYAIRHVGMDGLIPFVTNAFTFLAMVGVTAWISWQLALVALAISPILVLATRHYSGKLREKWKEVKRTESDAQSIVQQALASIRVVKAFGREEHEEQRFEDKARQGWRLNMSAARSESLFSLWIGMTIASGTAAVLYIGTRQVLSGAMTIGELLLVMSYLAQIYGPLKNSGTQVAQLQKSLASAERAYELLDTRVEVPDRSDAQRVVRARGDIRFDHVSFCYDSSEGARYALRDASFAVPAGTRVGISGHTGAGKTTLISLLMRLYDPTEGRILLDGTDLRDLRLADLRNQFGIVLQEPVLFSTSIAENIAYARPDATQGDIIEAARAAHAHDFIQALPQGYDTIVGERGMTLSGGERQRISLARAFLKDAPILILDEPTSSVDIDTEAKIVDALDRLMQARTAFMIAHRPTTLRHCSLHLHLDDGRVHVGAHLRGAASALHLAR